ncbi:MAG TPA: hypothetical protein VJU13_12160, partial [Candidatus Nitrosocosmicus sp.]|nr:hypothetical protein [Candidatus Nitrosocosmicus sp.]
LESKIAYNNFIHYKSRMFEIVGSLIFSASFVIDPTNFIKNQTFKNINIMNKNNNSKITY